MRLDVDPSLVPDEYAFVHRIRVRFAETDAMGIVHHANYLLYLEEARVEYLRSLGKPYTELRAEGVDHAVLECFVQYRSPLRFDDEVDVHLVVAKVTRATFQIAYLLTVDAQPRATAVTAHGSVNSAGRPVRLPAWLASFGSPPTNSAL
ncbi:MAG: thioesterase family protein [Ilumatobacteraceae bacterium]